MKLNEHIALSTSKLLLVPYFSHHVPEYHTWMQDPELQEATASEPLSVEEEYAMQRSWRTDRDKLTFIVCLPIDDQPESKAVVSGGTDDATERMIGDINLFLFDPVDDEDGDDETRNDSGRKVVGEIELMIARKDLHRQGYGRAALLAFLHYIISSWHEIAAEYAQDAGGNAASLEYLRVKINHNNARSIALFQSVGFERTTEEPNYFGEVELRWLNASLNSLEIQKGWEEPRVLIFNDAQRPN